MFLRIHRILKESVAFLFGIRIPSQSAVKTNVKANLPRISGQFLFPNSTTVGFRGLIMEQKYITQVLDGHPQPVFSFGKFDLRDKLRLQQGQIAAYRLVLSNELQDSNFDFQLIIVFCWYFLVSACLSLCGKIDTSLTAAPCNPIARHHSFALAPELPDPCQTPAKLMELWSFWSWKMLKLCEIIPLLVTCPASWERYSVTSMICTWRDCSIWNVASLRVHK